MAEALVFDIDGTLVTFKFDVRGTRGALIEELGRRGFVTEGLSMSTPTQQILDAARLQAAAGKVEADVEALRRAAYSILDEFEVKSAVESTPFPGTLDTLKRLRSAGVRMAVLTNSGRRAAEEVLGRFGFGDFFEFVLTRDETEAMKPRPEGLSLAVSKLSLPHDSVYYVGDSPFDITAAKLAGLKVVSVATGNYTAERLREEGADFVLGSIAELPDLLGV